MKKETRAARVQRRRDAKFEKHNIEIKNQAVVEIRWFDRKREHPVGIEFTHAVFQGARLVARASSYRHALKAAHNHIRRTRR